MTDTQTAKKPPRRDTAPALAPRDGDIVVTAARRGNFIISRADGRGWMRTLVVLDVTRLEALKRACDFLRPGLSLFFRSPGWMGADSYQRIRRVNVAQ